MLVQRDFGYLNHARIIYQNETEWGWVHPRGIIQSAHMFLEVMGITGPPDFPHSVRVRNSTLRAREAELLTAGYCSTDESPYSDLDRAIMRDLAMQISTHLGGRSAQAQGFDYRNNGH